MKSLLIARTVVGNDWYDKAKKFLSDNKCKPLALEISSEVDAAAIFREALSSLTATAPHQRAHDRCRCSGISGHHKPPKHADSGT